MPTTTGEAPFTLTSSSRSRTVGVAVTTGTGPFTLTSSSGAATLTVTPGPWVADSSQAATIIVDTVPAVGRLLPALASPPAGMNVVSLPIGADEITPLTVDGDGRVHSDGT